MSGSLTAPVATLLVAFLLWKLVARRLRPSQYSLAKVAGPRKEHWLTGNLHRLFNDGWDYKFDLLAKFGGVIKIYGMLGAEQLLVSDPRALHHIVVKEQDVYLETDMFVMTNKLLFGEGLISTLGEQHRKQRKMLNPVFSLANMRSLLPTIQPIADKLLERLRSELPKDGSAREIDILPWMTAGTLQYVSTAVMGITIDTMDRTKKNEYADALRAINPAAFKVLLLRPFVPMVVRNLSPYWRNKLVDWLPFPALRELRDISNILERAAKEIIQTKKAEMERGGESASDSQRRDLMTIMLRANMSTSEKDRLTEDELIGQINTLLFGGQETTTSALARMLYILAREPAAQARLRTEIRRAQQDHAAAHGSSAARAPSSLPYDVLVGLPYLDAVVRETLRVHPPTSMLNRTCTQDAVLPLEFPVRATTGEEVRAVHVPKGTNVVMSLLGANHNREVWGEDASVWRPERWLNAQGERIGQGRSADLAFGDYELGVEQGGEGTPGCRNGVKYPGVYASMMTFLGGGRACIGFKFAEMEIKQVLATLVPALHFALPSAVDAYGVRKEIYWRMDGLQFPVVRPPHGDGKTHLVPLDIRPVRETDFLPM
ncbi:cytochrome P450 [Earliella scabrosa]|nr:cytochrome P450 [Earliella scabrosa]